MTTDQQKFADDRPLRRDHWGLITGAVCGMLVALLLSAVEQRVATTAVLTLVGAIVGAYVGRGIAAHVSLDDLDRSPPAHSHVGARTPDDEGPERAPVSAAGPRRRWLRSVRGRPARARSDEAA